MTKLNWTINYDHWAAVTDHGTYEVGDCGDNRAFVTIPGRSGLTVSPFDSGKDVAQAFYDARGITLQEAAKVLLRGGSYEVFGPALSAMDTRMEESPEAAFSAALRAIAEVGE